MTFDRERTQGNSPCKCSHTEHVPNKSVCTSVQHFLYCSSPVVVVCEKFWTAERCPRSRVSRLVCTFAYTWLSADDQRNIKETENALRVRLTGHRNWTSSTEELRSQWPTFLSIGPLYGWLNVTAIEKIHKEDNEYRKQKESHWIEMIRSLTPDNLNLNPKPRPLRAIKLARRDWHWKVINKAPSPPTTRGSSLNHQIKKHESLSIHQPVQYNGPPRLKKPWVVKRRATDRGPTELQYSCMITSIDIIAYALIITAFLFWFA